MSNLWVEKYRPKGVEDMALDPDHRKLLTSYVTQGEIPHLLLVGPPGCGKTTIARMLNRLIDCQVLSLNASKDRGIDVVRQKISVFAKVKMGAPWKHVFLDEADGMTPDAQNSMRNLMEEYANQTRFILTANLGHKVISPLQSRCTIFKFGEVPLKERVLVLTRILEAEGQAVDLEAVMGYAQSFADLRRMITAAQQSVLAHGVLQPVTHERPITGAELLSLTDGGMVTAHWDTLVGWAKDPFFDHKAMLTEMFWAVVEGPKAASTRHQLARAVHETTWTPDPVVHFLGTCAELMS